MPKYKMPMRKRRARKPQARRPRRAPRRLLTTNVNRGLQPMAQRYICKQKYCENVTTNVDGQYLFNLNSVFDPNRTGIGHQPYGFDTLATLYNRYRVISCRWRIESATLATGNQKIIHVIPSNDPNIIWGSGSYVRENPRCKYTVLNPGASARPVTSSIYLPSLVGRTRAQYMADDSYQANVLQSPTENAILYIVSTDNFDNVTPVTVSVTLEYTVEYFDIKHQLQS